MQSLIKHYGIRDAPNLNTPGAKMYRSFDEETQDVLKPLMSSKYALRLIQIV